MWKHFQLIIHCSICPSQHSDLEKANVTWEWYNKRENSRIKDLFVGQLKSSLHCTHCEKTSVVYDPFWDLSGEMEGIIGYKLKIEFSL